MSRNFGRTLLALHRNMTITASLALPPPQKKKALRNIWMNPN